MRRTSYTLVSLLTLIGLLASCVPARRDDVTDLSPNTDAASRDLDSPRDARADGFTFDDVATLDVRGARDAGSRDAQGPSDARALPDGLGSDHARSADVVPSESGPGDAGSTAVDAAAGLDSASPSDAGPTWPHDASVPLACSDSAPDGSGSNWSGWANYQWPASARAVSGEILRPGEQSQSIFGQVYQAGVTDPPGAAAGFEAQLLVGPLGSSPLAGGHCFTAQGASYNSACDTPPGACGHNDEYMLQLTAPGAGLYGLFFRYRPAGGRWLYGDRDGSDNGVQVEQSGIMQVGGARNGRLVLATLNLRCRTDAWSERLPLVVAALARVDPDLVAFEEDCTDSAGLAQSWQIRQELSRYSRRGYQILRTPTHVASHPEGDFGEGLSVMSAHIIRAQQIVDLPPTPVVAPAHFQRRAVVVDIKVDGRALRFVATHLEYGGDNASTRDAQAQALLGLQAAQGLTVIAGDLNASPQEAAVQRLNAALADLWAAQSSDPGLSMPAWAPTRRIDYLFGSGALLPALGGARMLDERAGAVWLSDHRGVAVAVDWSPD